MEQIPSGTSTHFVNAIEPKPIGKVGAALAKAQGAMSPPPKNKSNPFFNSKYADLADCIEHTKKPLTDNGLSISQVIDIEQGMYILRTLLIHTSGEFIESKYILSKGLTPQKFGSELTYARRYSFCAIIGISADDDDDANLATSPKSAASKPRSQTTAPQESKTPIMQQFESARSAQARGELPPLPGDLDGADEGLGAYEKSASFILQLGKKDHKNYGQPLSNIHRQDLHKLQAWLESKDSLDDKAQETLYHIKNFLMLDKELNQ
jgi:hypothetical protein